MQPATASVFPMRAIPVVFVSTLVLAACGSGHSRPQATVTVSVTPSASPSASGSTTAPAADPIAAEIAAGGVPQCKLVVGLPTSTVVRGIDSKTKGVDVRCTTGSSTASDQTGAGSTPCNPLDAKSAPVYYWASQKTDNPDQHVYAAKKGGVVVVVPDQTAKEFFSIGGGLAAVLLAVGVC